MTQQEKNNETPTKSKCHKVFSW